MSEYGIQWFKKGIDEEGDEVIEQVPIREDLSAVVVHANDEGTVTFSSVGDKDSKSRNIAIEVQYAIELLMGGAKIVDEKIPDLRQPNFDGS